MSSDMASPIGSTPDACMVARPFDFVRMARQWTRLCHHTG